MIKLYFDWISQPSRAVKAVLDIVKIPYEQKALKVQFDEHKTPAFTAINPIQQVPAIVDGDFVLSESHAIMKYIIRSRNIQTQLYPYSDIKSTAKIDQYLDYHHTNTRRSLHLYHYVLISPLKGEHVIPENLEQEKQDVAKVFQHFEQYLLKNNEYICGDHLTIADISAASELIQLDMIKYNFAQYPKTQSWLKKVLSNPEVNAAHTVAFKIIKNKNPASDFLNLK